jgi:hypothetical protein
LETHRDEIHSGSLVVLFEDECHLLWGDVCGYVWGKTDQRIEVPTTNEWSKQTYYGVVNLHTQYCLIQAAETGNSANTIAFLNYLLAQYPDSRIVLIWDGATYHRSQEVKAYLERSIKDWMNPPGKSPVFGLQRMTQSRIQLRMFGCRRSDSFESTITCVCHSMWLSFYLSLSRIVKSLISLSFLPMVVSHNSFRTAIFSFDAYACF